MVVFIMGDAFKFNDIQKPSETKHYSVFAIMRCKETKANFNVAYDTDIVSLNNLPVCPTCNKVFILPGKHEIDHLGLDILTNPSSRYITHITEQINWQIKNEC